MKMVKSAFLASAAGLVAMSGAQAADLPVKAKPVEYVKVCSLYGAGFYYIPGTDICMKIGGYVRYQVSTGVGQSISFGPFTTTAGFNTRATGIDVAQRVRVLASWDTRQQTAYGTLRTYMTLGWTHDTPANAPAPSAPSVYFNRGFIQIAGFTFGKATSFFDFVSTAAVAYNAGFVSAPDTGDAGQLVLAYTAQFGNGVSASVAMEQSRRNGTVWVGPATLVAGGGTGFAVAGITRDDLGGAGAAGTASRPDFTANLRVDQAWGSAQISGAVHDVSTQYFGGPVPTSSTLAGHPDDKWGWAISGGLRLNTPMFGAGDYIQADAVYSEGAPKYASQSACAGSIVCDYYSGSAFAVGFAEDATFNGSAATVATPAVAGTFNLTTAWSVFASYEHFWTPSLRTSLYGSYLDVSRNAAGNTQVCNSVLSAAQFTAFSAGGFGCNMNFQYWAIGSRSQWNVTKDFYVGVDVIYGKLQSASINGGAPFAASAALLGSGSPSSATVGPVYHTANQDQISVTWRVHRDFVP